jgi:copper chaperone CopZ
MTMHAGDALTRTTLTIDDILAGTRIDDVVRALKRVPGVLLADASPGNARAVVAHDSAVPVNALIAAALAAGARVTVFRSPRAIAAAAAAIAPAAVKPSRPRIAVGTLAVAAALIAADVLLPNSPQKHIVLNALVIALWISFFVVAFLRRRS